MFLDNAPLIYFLERHIDFSALVFPFFKAHAENKLTFATSVVTVGEVLVQPFRDENDRLIAAYSQILKPSTDFEIVGVTYDIAVNAAKMRATYGFKTPDALLMSTALDVKADIFFTNDKKLKRMTELEVLCVSDL